METRQVTFHVMDGETITTIHNPDRRNTGFRIGVQKALDYIEEKGLNFVERWDGPSGLKVFKYRNDSDKRIREEIISFMR